MSILNMLMAAMSAQKFAGPSTFGVDNKQEWLPRDRRRGSNFERPPILDGCLPFVHPGFMGYQRTLDRLDCLIFPDFAINILALQSYWTGAMGQSCLDKPPTAAFLRPTRWTA